MSSLQHSSTAETPSPRGRTQWKRRLLAAFAVLLSLLVLSPILVSGTPLRNWLLTRAVPHFQGRIRIGGGSMGWFRPPIFTDIEIHDSAGRMLLHIPRLVGNKSLVALLCHPLDLGEFRLVQPVLHIVCSRDSSNLETALAYWLQRSGSASDGPGFTLDGIAIRAVLDQARVILEDEGTGRTWLIDPLDLTVAIPRNRRTPLHVELNARTAAHRGQWLLTSEEKEQPSSLTDCTGQLSANVSIHFVETNDGPQRLRAEGGLRAADLPLDVAGLFLHRLAPHLQLGGRLNADMKLRSPASSPPGTEADTGGMPDVQLEGSVSLHELALRDPLLGPDILRLQLVQAPVRISLDGTRLSVEQLAIHSEIGKVNLGGTIPLVQSAERRTQNENTFWQSAFGILRSALVNIEAELNLAHLAELVPNALHLTKETRMQSGALSLHLHSALRDDVVLWEGDLHTSDLEGLYQGQRVTWKEPLVVVLTAHQEINNPLPVLERLRCDSDFLRLEMSGSLQEWSLRGNFNLGRLSEHLDGFVELGALHVQGEGALRMTARRNLRGAYRLEGNVGFTQLSLTDGTRAWHEDNLTIHFDLLGDTTGGCRVDAGALHVLAGKDGIDVDLLEPIPDMSSVRAARFRLRLHGDLACWKDRVTSLTGLFDAMRLAGQIDMDSRLRYEPETVHLEDIKITGRTVRFQGFGLRVDEPSLDFTTSGRWLPERETLELQHTRLSCPSVTVQAPAATLSMDTVGAWQITASATVQGDVARLLSISGLRDNQTSGALAGRIDLRPDEGRQIAQLDLNVHNLVLGPPAAPVWRESRVNLIGHGVYDVVKDSLQIVQLHLDSPALSCDATGTLGALSSDMELSLEGRLGYDLEKLEPQLRPYLGQGVKLSGRDVRPFHIAGALRVDGRDSPFASTVQPSPCTRWHGSAAFSWQTLQALGCRIGPAELRGQLVDGCFRASAIEATLNQGRLHLEPSLLFEPLPAEVMLAKGRAIEHARLDPAACASALGYAVPVLAGAAQADGEFSLDLQSGCVPLANPAKADILGWLTIHSAQVSAAPLIQELSVLLKGPATLTLAKDNVVPFRMVNGRVYHTGLELHFPELTMRLSGSVGLDGSLSLTAEMPVPPKWLGSSKLAKAALGNQTIRLPIGGTLNHPKIDERALREASAKFVRDSAENALHQEEGKVKKEAESGLRKLFRRK